MVDESLAELAGKAYAGMVARLGEEYAKTGECTGIALAKPIKALEKLIEWARTEAGAEGTIVAAPASTIFYGVGWPSSILPSFEPILVLWDGGAAVHLPAYGKTVGPLETGQRLPDIVEELRREKHVYEDYVARTAPARLALAPCVLRLLAAGGEGADEVTAVASLETGPINVPPDTPGWAVVYGWAPEWEDTVVSWLLGCGEGVEPVPVDNTIAVLATKWCADQLKKIVYGASTWGPSLEELARITGLTGRRAPRPRGLPKLAYAQTGYNGLPSKARKAVLAALAAAVAAARPKPVIVKNWDELEGLLHKNEAGETRLEKERTPA